MMTHHEMNTINYAVGIQHYMKTGFRDDNNNNNNTKICYAHSHTLSMNRRCGQFTRWPDGVC